MGLWYICNIQFEHFRNETSIILAADATPEIIPNITSTEGVEMEVILDMLLIIITLLYHMKDSEGYTQIRFFVCVRIACLAWFERFQGLFDVDYGYLLLLIV